MKLAKFLIIGLIMTISFAGLSCKKSNPNPNVTPSSTTSASGTNDLTTVIPSSLDVSLKTYLDQAKLRAREWKQDAVLAQVTVKLPIDLVAGEASQTYTFGSASDSLNWWTMSISEITGKYVRAIIPKEDYLGNSLTPINEYYWKENYLSAFQIAELFSGKEFRKNNKDVLVTITLANGEPKGWLWWNVEYKTQDGEATNRVLVNPYDKSIVDETGNIISR